MEGVGDGIPDDVKRRSSVLMEALHTVSGGVLAKRGGMYGDGDVEMVSNPARGISAAQEIAKLRHQLRTQERQIEEQQKCSTDRRQKIEEHQRQFEEQQQLIKDQQRQILAILEQVALSNASSKSSGAIEDGDVTTTSSDADVDTVFTVASSGLAMSPVNGGGCIRHVELPPGLANDETTNEDSALPQARRISFLGRKKRRSSSARIAMYNIQSSETVKLGKL